MKLGYEIALINIYQYEQVREDEDFKRHRLEAETDGLLKLKIIVNENPLNILYTKDLEVEWPTKYHLIEYCKKQREFFHETFKNHPDEPLLPLLKPKAIPKSLYENTTATATQRILKPRTEGYLLALLPFRVD
jgi:hypothetical protein